MQLSDLTELKYSADGFVDFELEFGKYLLRLSGGKSAELFAAGALLCRELRFGSVGLDLKKYAGTEFPETGGKYIVLPEYETWMDALSDAEKCGVVCKESEAEKSVHTPLVLTESGRLLLRRYWQYEKVVLEKLLARKVFASKPQLYDGAGADGRVPDLQDLAVFAGMNSRLLILSGGPGTGKTTVAGRMLTEIFRLRPECNVICAAPTGKAQQRLAMQLAENAEHLAADDPVKERLQTLTCSTIHGLLYRKTVKEKLNNCDLLLLDECSMIALPLFAELFQVLPDSAGLILLGDRRQLTPVGSGSVFSDICCNGKTNMLPQSGAEIFNSAGGEIPVADEGVFSGYMVELLRNYRSASAPNICKAAEKIRDLSPEAAGEAAQFIAGLSGDDFICRDVPVKLYAQELKKIFRRKLIKNWTFSDIVKLCSSGSREDVATALEMIDKFKILCAVNESEWGVNGMNTLVLDLLNIKPAGDGNWKPGTVLLITENDKRTGLNNGDCGIVFNSAEGVKAKFSVCGDKEFALAALPAHTCGFALSIHKAQGSGVDDVLMILPPVPVRILSRELLYTGITRAAKHIEIWSCRKILTGTLSRAAERASGLGG